MKNRHILTAKEGSLQFYKYFANRFNGKTQVRVYWDQKLFVYDNAKYESFPAKEWKSFIKEAFKVKELNQKISGQFPFYTIESK